MLLYYYNTILLCYRITITSSRIISIANTLMNSADVIYQAWPEVWEAWGFGFRGLRKYPPHNLNPTLQQGNKAFWRIQIVGKNLSSLGGFRIRGVGSWYRVG